jgi:uncharacterized protein (UPF0261 family)
MPILRHRTTEDQRSAVPFIAVLATKDTKEAESAYLARLLSGLGHQIEIVDLDPSLWTNPDPGRSRAATMDMAALAVRDSLLSELSRGRCVGLCVIGGASGSAIASRLLRDAPLGVPKLLLSPIASGDTEPYIGASDTVVVSPVVDFVGRNDYVDAALERAAHLISAMVATYEPYPSSTATHFAATAFGVTSPLAAQLQEQVSREGTRLAVFSANGTGGQAYERFLAEGRVRGAFDLTMTELADELCGGVLSAGDTRGTAAGKFRVPQVMMPGALDMVNFGALESVPEVMLSRKRIEHTKSVTLVRTSPAENALLAHTIASLARLNPAGTTVIVPTRGFSLVSRPSGPFFDPEADAAFIDTLCDEPGIDVRIVDDEFNGTRTLAAVLEASETWRLTQ